MRMGPFQRYAVVAFISLVVYSTRANILPGQEVTILNNNDVGTGTLGNESMLSGGVLELDNNSNLTSVLPSNNLNSNGTRTRDANGPSTLWQDIIGGNGTLFLGNGINVIPGNNSTADHFNFTRKKQETEEDKEMRLLVDETLSLIAEGEAYIPFDPRQRDLVLLVGNTGAGKTTVANFLTDVENLEAYDVGDRILIRDINNGSAQHKISVNSTIISKTIFPDRIIDGSTGTVFYDMPGFSDTRNASVEIANAWFMKMVADHARRVKIIFVVNFSSLRSGETRTDFKSLLEHAVDYVRVPAKFYDAIGLIATKVESSKRAERIIKDISFFLKQTSKSLAQVFPDEVKRNKTSDVVEAFLATPNRISFFRQPEDVGYLVEMDDVMSQHSHMKELIQNNTAFVDKSREDFGISLSPKAVLVVLRIADVTYAKVTDAMTSISKKVGDEFNSLVSESRPETLGVIINTQKKIALFTEELLVAKSRAQYFQTLTTLTPKLSVLSNLTIYDELTAIKKHERSFGFFEDVSNKTLHPKVVEWTNPMEHLVRDSLERATDVSMGVNRLIEQATYFMGKSMMDALLQKVRTSTDKPQLLVEFEQSNYHVALIVNNLKSARTFNEFAGNVWRIWNYRSNENTTVDFPTFVEDVVLEDESSKTPSPFKLLSWVLPFDKVLTMMSRLQEQLKTDIEREAHIKDKQELQLRLNQTITSYTAQIDKQTTDYKQTLDDANKEQLKWIEQKEKENNKLQQQIKDMQGRIDTAVQSGGQGGGSCILGVTGIATPSGYVQVKNLKPHDLVLNSQGEPVRVIAVNTVFVPGGSRTFGFKGTEFGEVPFFTGGHTFMSPSGSILVQNKFELETVHPQMRTEFWVEQMPHENIQLQGFADGVPGNRTVPELTRGFVDETEPLYFLAVEGDGTYIANGFVCYHELPKFEAWPKTFVTIFTIVQHLPPRVEPFNVYSYRVLGAQVQGIMQLWEEYVTAKNGSVGVYGGLEDYRPALEQIYAGYGSMMNNPWQTNFGLVMYSWCGSFLHSHLDVQGLDPQPFIQMAINATESN